MSLHSRFRKLSVVLVLAAVYSASTVIGMDRPGEFFSADAVTHCAVSGSNYREVVVDVSTPVIVSLLSFPKIVMLNLCPAPGSARMADIVIQNLEPNTRYYRYIDRYANETTVMSDENGQYRFSIELTQPHGITFKQQKNTIHVPPQGAYDTSVGVWDAAMKVYTLQQDVNDGFVVEDDGVTIDGNGHRISGTDSGSVIPFGVDISDYSSVTIKNLHINGFGEGVRVSRSTNGRILNSHFIDCGIGIYMQFSSVMTIEGNEIVVADNCRAMFFFLTHHIAVRSNNLESNAFEGNTSLGISQGAFDSLNTFSYNRFHNFYFAMETFNYPKHIRFEGNLFSNNALAIMGNHPPAGTEIIGNSFLQNGDALVSSSDSLLTIDGNYWDVHTAPDADGDGVVDFPYNADTCYNEGGQTIIVDQNPHAMPYGPIPNISDLQAPEGVPVTVTWTLYEPAVAWASPVQYAQYKLDEGSWTDVLPSDGTFDELQEDFIITLPAFAGAGTHRIWVRGGDMQSFPGIETSGQLQIIGNRKPVSNAGQDQLLAAGNDCQRIVSLDGSNSSDPDNDTLSYRWISTFGIFTGPRPDIQLPVGTHEISLEVVDPNGLGDTDQVVIEVIDQSAPIPVLDTLPILSGECQVTITCTPVANDNCQGVVYATTSDPLSYINQGAYTVTWHYSDVSGNTTTQTQQVIVKDETAPVAVVASLPLIHGEHMVHVTTIPTAIDNCAGTIVGTTTDPLVYSTQGTYTIHWTYSDGHGNTTTQSQTVEVKFTPATILYSKQELYIGPRCVINNGSVKSDSYVLADAEGVFFGDILSAGNALVRSRTAVHGDIFTHGTSTVESGVVIDGQRVSGVNVNTTTIPQKWVQVGSTNVTVTTTTTLNPGKYGDVVVTAGATLILKAGVYNFKTVTVYWEGRMNFDIAASENATIQVRDKMVMYDRAKMVLSRPAVSPRNVAVYSNQSSLLDIAPECEIIGSFSAPNAEVRLRDRTVLSGTLQAKKISLMSTVTIQGL
ncbi:MAG: right-handed parallel beta-helix repeat-containing protein [Chitinivibrionales bacterium]|nr:right-handed parallel beta-helix repeat-containing protein [Chitinivibrionales bacterium]